MPRRVDPRKYHNYEEVSLPETSYEEDAKAASKPHYLLKVKDERPGRKARWTTVGAAWRRENRETGQEFFSINLNPCTILLSSENMPLCMFVNDKDREE